VHNGSGMKNRALTDELAELLDVERQEAAALFNGFCGAMVAELLAFRKLSIKGVGSFCVTHVPATKQGSGSSMIFSPPLNKLRFESTLSSGDETVSLAMSRLSMSQGEASRFARILATLFAAAMQQEQAMTLNGLGRFACEDGAYSFFPERTLEELLNREYQELKEVVLPRNEEPKRAWRVPRALLPVAAVFLFCALCFLFFGRSLLNIFTASSSPVVSSKNIGSAVVAPSSAALSPPVVRTKGLLGGAADSLVLAQGEYALVLATFESENRAFKELAPLRTQGINAFVWPAFMDGVKYFRLTTGRFATREAAAAQLKAMPANISNDAYLQQVKKTVVLHGEKGL
jgi:hypothetical protein